jgi:hypothetical protein
MSRAIFTDRLDRNDVEAQAIHDALRLKRKAGIKRSASSGARPASRVWPIASSSRYSAGAGGDRELKGGSSPSAIDSMAGGALVVAACMPLPLIG